MIKHKYCGSDLVFTVSLKGVYSGVGYKVGKDSIEFHPTEVYFHNMKAEIDAPYCDRCKVRIDNLDNVVLVCTVCQTTVDIKDTILVSAIIPNNGHRAAIVCSPDLENNECLNEYKKYYLNYDEKTKFSTVVEYNLNLTGVK